MGQIAHYPGLVLRTYFCREYITESFMSREFPDGACQLSYEYKRAYFTLP